MISRDTNIVYLHGFASGPASTKARYITERLGNAGYNVAVPDLNYPEFRSLTLTGQLKVIDETLSSANSNASGTVLIGSSMGGLLAVLKAPLVANLKALILLAPGFGLSRRWNHLLGEGELERWKAEGSIEVFHYGLNRPAPLDYNFIVDADRYQSEGFRVDVPTLVFHGLHDETVPIEESLRFSAENTNTVHLEKLDDDHQLIESLPLIWSMSERFLQNLN